MRRRALLVINGMFKHGKDNCKEAILCDLSARVRNNEHATYCELFETLHNPIVYLELGSSKCVHSFKEIYELLIGQICSHLERRDFPTLFYTLGPLRTVLYYFRHSKASQFNPTLEDEVSLYTLELVFKSFCEIAHTEGLRNI